MPRGPRPGLPLLLAHMCVQDRLSTSKRLFVIATFATLAVLLWQARREGPDFGHYFEWGNAALSGNIFELSADVLSPGGVPFSLAAALPGVLFATAYRVLGELVQFRTASYLTAWAAAMLFWISAFAALRSVARGNLALVAFAGGALFVGTHAGFYSFTYSTEVFASAFVAAAWAVALCGRGDPLASATVAAFAGLLLVVRPYLVLYALPPLWLVVTGAGDDTRPQSIHKTKLILAVAIIGLAALEAATVNRWMTGSPFRPPYVYGGFGFQSVDLLHPQFGAVLGHPWRGLLVYHPLYGIAFAALVVGAMRSGRFRVLWATTLGVVVLHLWVQSAWHIWWLGGSFGMRGLAPAALPMVLALVAALARQSNALPMWWVRAAMLACAWSFLLLLKADDDNRYFTWPALLRDQTPAALAAVVFAAGWVLVAVCRARWRTSFARPELVCSAIVVLVASIGYLIARMHLHADTTLFLMAGAAAAAVFVVDRLVRGSRVLARVAFAFAVFLFFAQAAMFGRLAAQTVRFLASGNPPPRHFGSVSDVPIADLSQNYVEYMNIPGFDDRKRRLRAYLNWLAMRAVAMAPADRELSERVLRAITADPVAGAMLVRVTALDGRVHLVSTDSNEATRRRVVEVATAVPGVAAVEADMK